jgi:hypothetical protein
LELWLEWQLGMWLEQKLNQELVFELNIYEVERVICTSNSWTTLLGCLSPFARNSAYGNLSRSVAASHTFLNCIKCIWSVNYTYALQDIPFILGACILSNFPIQTRIYAHKSKKNIYENIYENINLKRTILKNAHAYGNQ